MRTPNSSRTLNLHYHSCSTVTFASITMLEYGSCMARCPQLICGFSGTVDNTAEAAFLSHPLHTLNISLCLPGSHYSRTTSRSEGKWAVSRQSQRFFLAKQSFFFIIVGSKQPKLTR